MRNYKGAFGSLRFVTPSQMFKLVEAFSFSMKYHIITLTRVNTVLLSHKYVTR